MEWSVSMLNDCCDGTCCVVKRKSTVIYNKSLAKYVNGLLEQLRSKGYAEKTLHHYISRLRPIQSYMAKNGILDYSPEVGDDYYDYFSRSHSGCKGEEVELRACIRRLNDYYQEKVFVERLSDFDLQPIPSCYQNYVDSFLNDSLIISSKKSTISKRNRALARFLQKCILCNADEPSDFTPQIVLMACRDVPDKDDWITIRQFLFFLANNDRTKHDLSIYVPKSRREKKAPSTYSVEQLHMLEDSIDRNTRQGRRDYAVVLLADRLAIRAGDIAAMRYDSLDFCNNSITFMQSKTNTEITLPMLPEIRQALQNHLGNSDFSDGYIFHSMRAPYRPMTGKQVYSIVNKYFGKTNIDITGKHHGPHSLRASVSTSMVNDDVPYEAVSSILGHTSHNSIRNYAKNDIEKLRRCAIPVPAPQGVFQRFLMGGVQ
ncbi:MAG: tyrosine-type recombinase/integrase [Clostridia bacterium]|nr:tyrosine-type recombinase/integrase [Clostridia bacterium]